MIPANFDYEAPRTVKEAVALLSSREDAKILAGGHSLLPAMKMRLAAPPLLVDIGRIGELNYIRESNGKVAIGATTTHAEVAASPILHKASPLVSLAASNIGDTQVRNRGTIGGSLAGAHPAADYPAAVLALDAEIVVVGKSGERVIPATKFFTGMFSTELQPDEIITEIRVPRTDRQGVAYKKHHHPASGYAVVGVAVRVELSGKKIDNAAVAITGIADIAYRAFTVENELRGKPTSAIPEAAAHATIGVDAIGDTYASAEYRSHLATVYTHRALVEAVGKKG